MITATKEKLIEVRCKKCGYKICEIHAMFAVISFPCKRCKENNVVILDKQE